MHIHGVLPPTIGVGDPGCVFVVVIFLGLPSFALAGAIVQPFNRHDSVLGWCWAGWPRWILLARHFFLRASHAVIVIVFLFGPGQHGVLRANQKPRHSVVRPWLVTRLVRPRPACDGRFLVLIRSTTVGRMDRGGYAVQSSSSWWCSFS